MQNKILCYIKRHELLHPGDRVLVAVSGGADSVALLCALNEIAASTDITLAVAHLNHCIRGKEAEADAEFVKNLAGQLHIQCICGRADVPKQAKRDGVSLEMAARKARYDFLAKAARKAKTNSVATAHTADDQAETVLLKLARGAGTRGLAGIAARISIDGLLVIRPLLEARRIEIETYLRDRGQSWREDKTNLDPKHLRNRVRHEVLPFLEQKLNPDIRAALTRTADLLREDDSWLEELSANLQAKCMEPGTGAKGPVLHVEKLKPECLAAKRRVIRLWLSSAGIPPELIDYDSVARVEALLEEVGTGSTEIAGDWVVRRRYDRLVAEQGRVMATQSFRHVLKVPGETILAGLNIQTTLKPGLVKERGRIGCYPSKASISLPGDYNLKVVVRSWKQGDRMKPFGMAGSKKLHNIFIDEKIPVEERASIPVFECSGEIIWIPGYRVARGWEVKDPAAPSLQITVMRQIRPAVSKSYK